MNLTARRSVEQNLSRGYLMVASAQPGYATPGMLVSWIIGDNTQGASFTPFTLPVIGVGPDNGGPTSSRFTKVGLRVTNSTPQLYRGGRVYVCRIPQRMRLPGPPQDMSGNSWDVLCATLISYPETGPTRCNVHEWAQFGQGGTMADRPIFCRVNDEAIYQRFLPHQGAVGSGNAFFDNIAQWPGSTTDTRSMTTVLMFWTTGNNVDKLQEITINADAQMLTRWPLETAPGHLSVDVPPATAKAVGESRNPAPTESSGGKR